ncbi:hypothetical protein ACIQMJ_14550 [Actinosynnema sp. NPDC091369]
MSVAWLGRLDRATRRKPEVSPQAARAAAGADVATVPARTSSRESSTFAVRDVISLMPVNADHTGRRGDRRKVDRA